MDSLIVYVHIPKTAGTTMVNLFRAWYDPACVFHHRVEAPFNGHSDPDAVRVLMGHFPYDYPALNGRLRLTLTMLREPLARVYSLYRYLQRTTDHPLHKRVSVMSFIEYVTSPLDPNVRDGMARFLAGGGIARKPRLERGDLQRAKVHLETCAAFGFTERFAESLALFEVALGITVTQPAMRKNPNPAPDDPPAEAVDIVRTNNTLDLELYEYAQDQFEKRLALHPLAARVARLKDLGW